MMIMCHQSQTLKVSGTMHGSTPSVNMFPVLFFVKSFYCTLFFFFKDDVHRVFFFFPEVRDYSFRRAF